MYPLQRNGSFTPAKGVGVLKRARVQIPPSPPKVPDIYKTIDIWYFFYIFCLIFNKY